MWIQRLMDSLGNRWFEFALPPDKAVDFLGVMYASPSNDPESAKLVLEAFLDDFRSLLWLSYRRDFEALVDKDGASTGIGSDAGWGCSIRVSQMLIAQSLSYLKMGRNRSKIDEKTAELFCDNLHAPLSIHRIVQAGHARFGKKPSEWFGPTTGARTIESLLNDGLENVKCVSFDGGEIVSSQVSEFFLNSPNIEGVVVLLTHRLGLESFNLARYKGTIQTLFSHPFFQGLSSGESIASAYYFFAASDDHLLYLDPHTVQPALVGGEGLMDQIVPQPKPLKMRWQRLNPSMTMGFAVRSVAEWNALCEYLVKIDRELFDVTEKRRETPKFTDISDETDQVVLIS